MLNYEKKKKRIIKTREGYSKHSVNMKSRQRTKMKLDDKVCENKTIAITHLDE